MQNLQRNEFTSYSLAYQYRSEQASPSQHTILPVKQRGRKFIYKVIKL